MTDDRKVIHLPALPQPTDRERRAELRRLREQLVTKSVVKLKTFKGLRDLDELLTKRIKLEESRNPGASGKPKEPA